MPFDYLRSKEEVHQFIQYAYENKKGIYSVEPEGPPDQIEAEVNAGKESFGEIVFEEQERIQRIAQEENVRVMQLQKENDTDVTCPFCLEEIPAIYPPGTGPMIMGCCGARTCWNCGLRYTRKNGGIKKRSLTCFSCRRDVYSASLEDLAENGSKSGKGSALFDLGIKLHRRGKFQESFESFRKAAELDNAASCAALAQLYFLGGFGKEGIQVEKSIEKAKELAQRGSDQGNVFCNQILSHIYWDDILQRIRYLSLAAYQGHQLAMRDLAKYYISNLQSNLDMGMLAIYWSGKVLETEYGDQNDYTIFLLGIEYAMRCVWHRRTYFDIEPLTGCSHVPLCNFIRRRVGNVRPGPEADLKDILVNMPHSVWMDICANCGNRTKEILKVCANCKSFSYCSKKCQVMHWRAGHKVDCKGHWIEKYFPNIRNPKSNDCVAGIILNLEYAQKYAGW